MADVLWRGGRELEAAFMAKAAKAPLAAERAVSETCEAMADIARAAAKVRTGAMRDGIGVEMSGTTGRVVSVSPHSRFVDNGTKFMAAQPFFTPAQQKGAALLPEAIATKLQEI